MSLGVTVKGGTGAGSRIVKSLPMWACKCPPVDGRLKLTDRYSCPDCGARRPTP